MRKILSAAVAAIALTVAAPAAAATLNAFGSTVIGVNGLVVGSNTYDVNFFGGNNISCDALFAPCAQSSFAFTTSATALDAANALFSVIGTVPTNDLAGCVEPGSGYACYIYVPYAVSGLSVSVADILTYGDGSVSGSTGLTSAGVTQSFASQGAFAKFTLVANDTAVPEPATWAMMLLGFGAIGLSVRRKGLRRTNYLSQFA